MSRMLGGSALAGLLAAGTLWLAPAAGAATFTVNVTGDGADASLGDSACDADVVADGPQCTLRAAIQQANALGGADVIGFALAAGNTIAPGTPLPSVTDAVTIDGTTQALQGRVEIDGSGAGSSASGLTVSGASTTIAGLVINRFALVGLQLTAGGATITGNRIGTSQDGTVARPNGNAGIQISNGTGDVIAANLVSANSTGILVNGGDGISIADNRIGTDASGAVALPNTPGRGLQLNAGAKDAVVSGNVISGNGSEGVAIGPGATGSRLTGNRIGTNAAGTAALPNATGVSVGGSGTTIGGTAAADRNVISGNTSFGISHEGNPSGTVVRGNHIGTNAAGTGAVRNGADGVRVVQASNTAIGGAADGAGNLISGNGAGGVLVSGGDATSIVGNRIGTDAAGSGALPNAQAGVNLGNGGNVVEGNRIAFNGHDGIQVSGGNGNRFQGNSLTANGEGAGDLGIDLDANGVSPNDGSPDSDLGANGDQNFPVLSPAESGGGTLSVSGVLHSALSSTYRVELFSSPSCDTAGHGEGATFLEGFDVATDGTGEASFSRTLAREVPVGAVITATATSVGGSTSELGPCATVKAAATTPPAISIADAATPEGDSGTNTESFVLTLDHASGQAVSVGFATSDGTAEAGSDYTAKTVTATFAAGATQAIVTVLVTGDTLDEPDEAFTATLSGARNATIADAVATGTITDDDPPPSVSIGDVNVPEPESGTAIASFPVTLSAASGKTVTVDYSTADVTAHAGSDYTAKSGTVTFAPGDTARTVDVDVLADGADDPGETFSVALSDPSNATMGDGTGLATIEAPPPSVSMRDAVKAEPDPGMPGHAGGVTLVPELSRPYGQDVTITLAAHDGSALSPGDYTATSPHTVTIRAGQRLAGINPALEPDGLAVVVAADTLAEPDETMSATITNVTGGATIADDTGTLTIRNKGGFPFLGPDTKVGLGGAAPVVVSPAGVAPIVVTNKNPFPVKGTLGLTVTGTAKAGGASAAAKRRITAGKRTFKLGARKKKVVKVKLSRRVRKLLKPGRRMTARATLTLRDPAGTKRKMSRKIRLVRRRG